MHGFKRPVMPRTGVRPLLFTSKIRMAFRRNQWLPIGSNMKQHSFYILIILFTFFFPGSFNLLGHIFGNARALLAFRLLAPQDPQFGVASPGSSSFSSF